MPSLEMPYLTAELPGVGGRIRERLEDFRVDEIPLYPAGGAGTHVYVTIRKRGIPTPEAVRRIAKYMGVRPDRIGFAGLKDARAVATQRLSIEHADPDKLQRYRDSQIEVLDVQRHSNKIRTGHLAGNRFGIHIRGIGADRAGQARAIIDVLRRRGVPNCFGPQRFGRRGETAELGRALVLDELDEFLAVYLGRPIEDDPPDCRRAREAFDAGDLDAAMDAWPRHYGAPRRALAAYRRSGRPGPVIATIDKRMRRLYVSAFQSEIFNDVLRRRIQTVDRVLQGDMAQKTDTGGIFTVEDTAAEQPRADAFEISPTGPIVGYRSGLAGGEPGRIEREAIAARGVAQEDFRRVGRLKAKGSRRPLRFAIRDCELTDGCDDGGEFLLLEFTAPSGCYATIVLREIMKAE